MKKKGILLPLILLFLAACPSINPLFYDFESEADLDRIYWKCKTLFSLSDKHTSSGEKSLKMELFPSPYPGIELEEFSSDWSNHRFLTFDIFNSEETSFLLYLRIDSNTNPSYNNNNRFNASYLLKQGANHFSVPLNSMMISNTKRKLNLSKIEKVILFLVNPKEKRTIYLDNLRVE